MISAAVWTRAKAQARVQLTRLPACGTVYPRTGNVHVACLAVSRGGCMWKLAGWS